MSREYGFIRGVSPEIRLLRIQQAIEELGRQLDDIHEQTMIDLTPEEFTEALALKASTASVAAIEANAWVTRPRLSAEVAADVANSRTPLRTFHRALANAAVAPCDILVVGDSISEGLQTSSRELRYIALLREAMRARYQPAATVGGEGYIPTYYQGVTPVDAFTVAGSPVAGGYGLGRRTYLLNASGQTLTLTGITCTGFDIYYVKSTSGTFSYSVDGGAATNVVVNGTASDGNIIQVRGLSVGAHTIVLAWVSGSSFVDGVMIFNGDETKGIRVWDGSRSGSYTNYYLLDTLWTGCLTPIQPDLVVIFLGTNDYSTNVVPATFKTQMLALIAAIRAKCTTLPSICLVLPPNIGAAATYAMSLYRDALKEIAIADTDMVVFDAHDRFGSLPWTAGVDLINSDQTHWNDLGHRFAANALTGFLLPK